MPRAPIPANEAARLAALREYGVLDTPAERDFDDLTALAAQACQVPIALISLVDEDRQWFKSKVGLCTPETSRDAAFCAHAIRRDEPLVIRDATRDPRTKDNPLVNGPPYIRFYAGVPLRNPEGFALGTLCVLDTQPRDISPQQLQCLETLARHAVAQLELCRDVAAARRTNRVLDQSRFTIGRAPLVTLAASLIVTALAVVQMQRASDALAQQRFERLNEHVVSEISRRATLPVYGLKGARGVYAASHSVERNEFAAYVASRDLPREFPGVLGFGFIERVMRRDLEPFVAAERADDAPTFTVRPMSSPAETFDDLYVVKALYPSGRNDALWGVDFGTDATRRAAIERAIRTGEPTISPAIRLMQDPAGRAGFLSLVPVYRNGTHPQTPEERTASLVGVLSASVLVDDALAGVADGVDGMVDFKLFDGPAADAGQLMFGTGDAPDASRRHVTLSNTATLTVGGRTWTLETTASPKFLATANNWLPRASGVGGAMLSLMLSAVVWSLGRSRAHAIALASDMTLDLSIARDAAIRNAAELKGSSDMLRRTGEVARVGGWELALSPTALTWSDEVYRIHEVAVGEPMTVERAIEFYRSDARAAVAEAVRAATADGTPWDLELPLVTAGGNQIWVRAQGDCVRERGVIVKLCGAFQDVTARKTAEDALRRSATHDKLTGLPNRAMLTDRLQRCLDRAGVGSPASYAVLFMDFDRFKWTNDTLGHEAGDDLLRQIAERLRGVIRPADDVFGTAANGSIVGRLGGDEFVVILDDVSGPDDATNVAARLLDVLAAPYRIRGHEVVSTASIGVVASDARYRRPDEMLRDADIAMYQAKLAGKARYVIFDAAMYARVQDRIRIEADLRGALESGQLSLAFQPIVSLTTGEYDGVEALLRWQHPVRGAIDPSEFLPVAEESGLILPIGDWVLRAACEQFAAWQKSLGDRAPRSVSVNVSRKQLALRDLPERIAAIIGETGVRPECVHLEIAESAMMKDPAFAKHLLGRLHEVGVKIDMDDFGTGSSSLTMLHQFPIDVLKIDRSFVANLGGGREFAAIVQAIAQLTRNLGIQVAAEGIETPEQLAMLQTLDCDLGQGHCLGRPMTASALETLLNDTILRTPDDLQDRSLDAREAA